MSNLINEIKNTARTLLADKKVDVVIGFEKGTMPLKATPCFIRTVEDVERLIWDETCENNLAKFAKQVQGKKAIIAKGCDSRALALLIQEGQFEREEIVVIGAPCNGLIDTRKIENEIGEILVAEIKDGKVAVEGLEATKIYDLNEVIDKTCQKCRYPNPVFADIDLAANTKEALNEVAASTAPSMQESYEDVIEFENKSPKEREDFFRNEMSKCIRCYACRNACPMCYCQECFVDSNSPTWLTGGVDVAENLFFHMGRMLHLAGRCVDCGACRRACPQGIDLAAISRKVNKDVLEMYHHEAGVTLDGQPALNEYNVNDPQKFLVKE